MFIIDYIYFTIYGLLQVEAIQWIIGLFIVFAIIGYLDEFNTKLKRRYKAIAIFWDWFEKIFWFIVVIGGVVFFVLFIFYVFNGKI